VFLLTEELRLTLEAAQKRAKGEFVFHRNGKAISDVRGAWDLAVMAAGCPALTLHDFRRHAGSRIMPSSGLEGCLFGPLTINLALAKSA
jgi:hypothetical protein